MKIRFPSTIDTDEHEVLLAYQKLITMFWRFDESGVFEMLDEYGFDISQVPARQGVDEGIVSLRRQLDESHVEMQSLNNVQALDIVVTRLWMRILLWRLAASHGFFPHDYEDDTQPSNDPICIAQDLLEVVVKAEKAAIEAHGPALVRSKPMTLQYQVDVSVGNQDLRNCKHCRGCLLHCGWRLATSKRASTASSRCACTDEGFAVEQSASFEYAPE